MDIQSLIKDIYRDLMWENKKRASYAAGDREFAPALSASFIEQQKLAEAKGKREKDIQEQKLAAEQGRTRMTEEGNLERTKLTEAGATGRTRMTEAGALERARLLDTGQTTRTGMTTASDLERARLTDTGATTRTILQEGGLDSRARAGAITPMQEFVKQAPEFMKGLAENPGITPEMLDQGMQMYWQYAAALGGGGDMDFTPTDQAAVAPAGRTPLQTMPPADVTPARTSARTPLAAVPTSKKKPVSTRTPAPEGAPTPFAPKPEQVPKTPWERRFTETFPSSSGLHALGSGAQKLGETGALKRFPKDSILGRLHERYYK